MDKSALVTSLFEIGLIKFGEFTFKSGIKSPNYLDHRILVSYPKVLKEVAKAYDLILDGLQFDRMIAIPYAAMPIVGAISLYNERPWIYTRKERKGYGTDKLIEGIYQPSETGVLIDDVITTGGSKLESIDAIATTGLVVRDVVVFIDRQQGGSEAMAARGLRVHAVFTLSEVFTILKDAGLISESQYADNMASVTRPVSSV